MDKKLENAKPPTLKQANSKEVKPNKESEPCACCALFFGDYAVQELELRWNNSRGLQALVKELLDEGFGHFAKPVLWRWRKLSPSAAGYDALRSKVDEQIWLAGSSPHIHKAWDLPSTNEDIERGVEHDLALLQRRWGEEQNPGKKAKQK